MYVDLVGLSLVITTILFLYFKKFRITFFTLTIVFLLALLFTQTRNAWITSAFVVMGIGIQYVIRSIKEGISLAALMFKVFIFLIPIFFVVIQISQSDVAVFERANVSALSQTRDTEEYMKTAGSFITRIFIWDTTINAFLANPVTGIGFYTFPFLSKNYSELDPELYKLFVEGLPPHQTYLAILGETGIIGFIGFIIFVSVILITSFRNMKLAKVGPDKLFATLAFWLFFYVLISMIMTDAWLWGTLFMVFSVIIALIDSNSRMMYKS
ncbi:MAG: O-antigen ligase family protein [Ignavibacterium sp.]|nr:O-antigen ligase family protein [Ignavibacterium sp.]